MVLNELFDQDEENYYDPEQDQTVPKLTDLRKTKLTLGMISRMRLIRDVRNFELRTNLENVRRQFGQSPENAGGGI
jgi:hypothetical protein